MSRNAVKLLAALCAALIFIATPAGVPSAAASASNDVPRLLMSEYAVNGGENGKVSAGNFTISYTLHNPSAAGAVNTILTYEQKSSYILPAPGKANVEYIGFVRAGGEYRGTIELFIPEYVHTGIYKLDFTLSYNPSDPSYYSSLSTVFSVYIEIGGDSEMVIKSAELSDDGPASLRKRLTVEYENPGSGDYKNLNLIVEGDIAEGRKAQTLPSLKAGRSNSIEYYVQFAEAGEQQFELYIEYEDDGGNVYKTEVVKKTALVSEDAGARPPAGSSQNEGYVSGIINRLKDFASSKEFIILFVIVLLAAAAAAVILPRARTRAKKKNWYYKSDGGKDGGGL